MRSLLGSLLIVSAVPVCAHGTDRIGTAKPVPQATDQPNTGIVVKPPTPGKVPEFVQGVLSWLPTDTETLRVARDFVLDTNLLQQLKDDEFDRKLATSNGLLTVGLMPGPLEETFVGQPIRWAVRGGRNYDIVSKFGQLRMEGATVLQFANDVLAGEGGRRLEQRLRKSAKEVRTVAGCQVFCFPPREMPKKTGSLERVELKPWQGEYVVLLPPDVLIAATSDSYLGELLRRRGGTPKGRALAPDLAEWKYVEPGAQAWFVRHIPAPEPSGSLRGLVWWVEPGKTPAVRGVALPLPGRSAEGGARQLKEVHTLRGLADDDVQRQVQALRPAFDYRTAPDGTVTFGITLHPGQNAVIQFLDLEWLLLGYMEKGWR
jgi:hypothetical protein